LGRMRFAGSAFLRPNHATCFGAGLRAKPLRNCRAKASNTEKERRKDNAFYHGKPFCESRVPADNRSRSALRFT